MVLGAALSALPALSAPSSREHLRVVTDTNELLRFNTSQPQRLLERRSIQGLADGERIVSLDFAGAPQALYARGSSGQIYRLVDEAAFARATIEAPAFSLESTRLQGRPELEHDRLRVIRPAHLGMGLPSELSQPGVGRVAPANLDVGGPDGGAYLATTVGERWKLFQIDLQHGEAHAIGTLATFDPVRAIAIEP